MKEFFVVLVVVILLIRGLAKLGVGSKEDAPRPRVRKRATKPPRQAKIHRGPTHTPRGATHKSPSAPAKPGPTRPPVLRRPLFGRKKTPAAGGEPATPPAQAPGSETYVRYLLDVLRVGEPAASRHAVEKLVEMGKPALPYLQEASRDSSPFVRERAQQASRRILEALTLAGTPEGAPRLEEEGIALPPARERRPALFDKSKPTHAPEAEAEPEPPPLPSGEPVPRADDASVEVPETEEETGPDADEEISAVEAVAGILTAAASEPSFGGRREEILEPLKLAKTRFTVVVDRVQWTGAFGVSEVSRGGRTVAGTIREVGLPVAVCLPKARNAYADALKDGDAFGFGGTFAAWDAMYDRGKFEGDLLEEPAAEA